MASRKLVIPVLQKETLVIESFSEEVTVEEISSSEDVRSDNTPIPRDEPFGVVIVRTLGSLWEVIQHELGQSADDFWSRSSEQLIKEMVFTQMLAYESKNYIGDTLLLAHRRNMLPFKAASCANHRAVHISVPPHNTYSAYAYDEVSTECHKADLFEPAINANRRSAIVLSGGCGESCIRALLIWMEEERLREHARTRLIDAMLLAYRTYIGSSDAARCDVGLATGNLIDFWSTGKLPHPKVAVSGVDAPAGRCGEDHHSRRPESTTKVNSNYRSVAARRFTARAAGVEKPLCGTFKKGLLVALNESLGSGHMKRSAIWQQTMAA